MKPTITFFPKLEQGMALDVLAGFVGEVGADTVNAVVREHYWIEPATLTTGLPKFRKAMEAEGLKVSFCTLGYSIEALLADDTPVRVLAENGITDFRIGYFKLPSASPEVFQCLKTARSGMEQLASVCQKHRIRAVLQVHHNTLVASASAAWPIVEGLPPEALGIMLDPGNQRHEGWESPGYAIPLLGPHLSGVGVKDMLWYRDQGDVKGPRKGWKQEWASILDGVTNWERYVEVLRENEFSGHFVFMPFHNPEDSDQRKETLRREISYIRKLWSETESKN